MSGGEEEVILRNSISMSGMRNLHVVRVGKAVDRARWLAGLPGQCLGLESHFAWMEGEVIKRHHLMIWWPCRLELVEGKERGMMVITRLIKGDRIGEVIMAAALTFWAATDRWPHQAVMQKFPAKTPDYMEIGEGRVLLVPAAWALRKCVVVCGGTNG